ncbi:hypothetical protein [Parendozoicomonas sp. Alg238-R29]|uniref:hypothetical protein n=1 Tax=Parendozoicomonas sp. Alg238-R29 TaxID=2993446 RepID=UPI00248D53D9|nr:hypothetical protein [Parendozoicomonas sp. Alg238-R29]
MASPDIGRSAQRVFKHYKKHYSDITTLFELSNLSLPSSPAISNELPDDVLALQQKADQSLEQLKQYTADVDALNNIDPSQLQSKNPELCMALVNYKKDLDVLFSAIQAVKAKAPKSASKKGKRVRTPKF